MSTMYMSPRLLVECLCKRFSLTGPREPIDAAAPAILAHIETLEADAREAHSAAEALGCTVADLVDRVKEPRSNTAAPTYLSLLQQLHALIPLARREGTIPLFPREAPAVLDRLRKLIQDLQEELAQAHRERDEAQRGEVALANQTPDACDPLVTFVQQLHTLLPDRDLHVADQVMPDDILGRVRWLVGLEASEKAAAQRLYQELLTIMHRVNAALPPEHRGMVPNTPGHAAEVIGNVGSFVAHHGHKMEALRLLAEEVHDARKALGLTDPHAHLAPAIQALQADCTGHRVTAAQRAVLLDEVARALGRPLSAPFEGIPSAVENLVATVAQLPPMANTLQAITEALPAELRYTEDIAVAVRQLVAASKIDYDRAQRIQEEAAPDRQIVGILRELLADSKPLCIALARELYSTDDHLLDLLETLPSERLAATLMESLAVPHDQPIPTTEAPSPQAKTLEGLCSVAFRRYPLRPGRLEAIGGNLLRFKPESGGELILNCDRRDLEVYPLDPSDLKATFNDPIAAAPKPPDDDIPW